LRSLNAFALGEVFIISQMNFLETLKILIPTVQLPIIDNCFCLIEVDVWMANQFFKCRKVIEKKSIDASVAAKASGVGS
jgi:hypothetical protein